MFGGPSSLLRSGRNEFLVGPCPKRLLRQWKGRDDPPEAGASELLETPGREAKLHQRLPPNGLRVGSWAQVVLRRGGSTWKDLAG